MIEDGRNFEAIGRRVSQFAHLLHMKQCNMAELLGIQQSSFSNWMSGKKGISSLSLWKMNALGCSIDWLLC